MAKTRTQTVCGGQVAVYVTKDDSTGVVTDVELVNQHKEQWTVVVRSGASSWTVVARSGETVSLAGSEKTAITTKAVKLLTPEEAKLATVSDRDATKRVSIELRRG